MSQQNPTIIVGHLDDSELTKSIDKLVAEVAQKTSGMAENFTQAIDKMKFAMKDFAVTQKVSVDLMKEAWRDMSKSFDAMVAAQSAVTGGGKGSGKGKVFAPNTVGALEQEIALEKEKRREMQLGSDELRTQNQLLEQRSSRLKQETTSAEGNLLKAFKVRMGNVISLPSKTFSDANEKLRRLRELLDDMQKRPFLFNESQINRVKNAIDSVETKIERMRKKFGSQGTQPNTLQQVLGMDENSFDAISKKMAALKKLSWSNPQEQKQLISEYQRLRQEQTKLMASNARMARSNNYLAQSFGYIRNRIVYALTLGAITNFIKQLYEIRGQYELLERSLGVLVGSFEKGTQIFNELNEMAIKSPFTLIELGTAAKQLTAYNFAANEVVDTTRRLADISAALGVPMERLTYNLGQIKAQGVLNARDARDFANAGLAIVPMLAKMYTEQKTFGDEMVTTAQVYDMMSKKMVTYSDVLKVLYKVTDEGGKFFDFQAKQADTLRVQMANLTLAYNNMLNEIGSENQGILSGMVSGLKTLSKNWREISRAILTLVTTLGTYKAVATIIAALNSRMFVGRVIVSIMQYIKGIKAATGAMATFNAVTKMNPIGFLVSALAAAVGYFVLFDNSVSEASEIVEQFGESGAKSLKKIDTLQKVLNGTSKTSSVYKKTLEELSTITSEYGVQLDKENAKRSDINKAIKQTIQLIKEESSERQRANQLEQARSTYESETETARKELQETLAKSSNISGGGVDAAYLNAIKENSEAITSIVEEVVASNIHLIVNKSGEELEKGIFDLYAIINTRLEKVGISGGYIQQILSGFLSSTSAVEKFAISIADANEKLERRGKIIERNKQVADEATQATMTFTQKVDANARALRNNTEDAISLYNRVYDIVKIAKENHVINFDLKLSAEKPPKWMFDKSLTELQQLAERFTAIAQSGGHAKGYDRESTYERGLMYASAARIKQEEEERNARNKDHKTRTKQSDEIAKAIKNEISLVKELQSAYDTLTKKGDSYANAIAKVQDLYGKTIDLLNKDMDKFGLPRLDLSIIKGNNHNEVLAFFEKLRDVLESKGLSNLERMEAVEGVVKEFRLKAETYNLDMITKGLNNELGKLKDEYELAIELDANPELSNMFADMFGITPDILSEMPHTVGQLVDKYQDEIDKQLKGKFSTPFNVLKTDINEWAKAANVDPQSELIKTLSSKQNGARELVKKTYLDIQKMVDDYVKEYGDQQQQIEKIEKEKNNALLQLNSIYNTDALRQKKEYIEAKEAIENAARIKEAKAAFAALKKTTDYDRFFNAIDTLTSKDALAIKAKIKQGIIQAFEDGGLTVSEFRREIKALESQFDKLTESSSLWTNYLSGGFDKLIQKAKETGQEIETIGESISIKGTIDDKDKNFLQSMGNIFSDGNGGSMDFTSLMNKFGKNMKGLGQAVSQAGQGMQQGAGGFASTIAIIDMIIKNVHQTVQAIGSVIDELDSVRNEESKISNAYWEGFKKSDSYATSGWENLKSGNIAGAVSDTANSLISLFNVFENAKNEKINEQIKDSERSVKNLENAYKNLEYAAGNAFGAATSGAQEAIKANKELQLVELKRQLALEQSRSSKHRDENRIIEIKGQIIDLEHEINDFTKNAVNDLLGISSHGDFFESMISEMIEAFKNGEDAMEVFEEKWSNMIDNMIMKTIVSQVLSQWVKTLEHGANDILEKYTGNTSKIMAGYASHVTNLRTMDATDVFRWIYNNDKETLNKILESMGLGTVGDMHDPLKEASWFSQAWETGLAKQIINAYFTMLNNNMAGLQDVLDKQSLDATGELIDYYGEAGKEFKENYLGQILDKIQENWNFGQDSEKQLSNLQQGIQGLSEDTGSALESYMNGVSQQVYYHSSLLEQIRDSVVGLDLDVSLGVQSQILLQLQSSYQVQMSIQGILEGVLNPSGRAFSVELVS